MSRMQTLMRGLEKMDRVSWSKQETQLFEQIKAKLSAQLDTIFVNFVYYVEKLAAVDIKGLIKCLEFIHTPEKVASVLTMYFKVLF